MSACRCSWVRIYNRRYLDRKHARALVPCENEASSLVSPRGRMFISPAHVRGVSPLHVAAARVDTLVLLHSEAITLFVQVIWIYVCSLELYDVSLSARTLCLIQHPDDTRVNTIRSTIHVLNTRDVDERLMKYLIAPAKQCNSPREILDNAPTRVARRMRAGLAEFGAEWKNAETSARRENRFHQCGGRDNWDSAKKQ